jgi:hypothetical protein
MKRSLPWISLFLFLALAAGAQSYRPTTNLVWATNIAASDAVLLNWSDGTNRHTRQSAISNLPIASLAGILKATNTTMGIITNEQVLAMPPMHTLGAASPFYLFNYGCVAPYYADTADKFLGVVDVSAFWGRGIRGCDMTTPGYYWIANGGPYSLAEHGLEGFTVHAGYLGAGARIGSYGNQVFQVRPNTMTLSGGVNWTWPGPVIQNHWPYAAIYTGNNAMSDGGNCWFGGTGQPFVQLYNQGPAMDAQIKLASSSTNVTGATIKFLRGTGTFSGSTNFGLPNAAASSGKIVAYLDGTIWDGSAEQHSVAVLFDIDNSVSAGVAPGRFRVRTGTATANVTDRLRVGSDGSVLWPAGGPMVIEKAAGDSARGLLFVDDDLTGGPFSGAGLTPTLTDKTFLSLGRGYSTAAVGGASVRGRTGDDQDATGLLLDGISGATGAVTKAAVRVSGYKATEDRSHLRGLAAGEPLLEVSNGGTNAVAKVSAEGNLSVSGLLSGNGAGLTNYLVPMSWSQTSFGTISTWPRYFDFQFGSSGHSSSFHMPRYFSRATLITNAQLSGTFSYGTNLSFYIATASSFAGTPTIQSNGIVLSYTGASNTVQTVTSGSGSFVVPANTYVCWALQLSGAFSAAGNDPHCKIYWEERIVQ